MKILPILLFLTSFLTSFVPAQAEPTWNEFNWSDPAAWPNGQVPGIGQDVTIPAYTTIILDTNTESLGKLHIHGRLTTNISIPVNITAKEICVHEHGFLEIGAPSRPQEAKVIITLTGERGSPSLRTIDNGLNPDTQRPNSRGLMVHDHGTLRLFGKVQGLQKTKLNHPSNNSYLQGSQSFTVANTISWEDGDRIAIGITDFYGIGETEFHTLNGNSTTNSFVTSLGLATSRWARLQYPNDDVDTTPGINNHISTRQVKYTQPGFPLPRDSSPTVLDQRAEVVRLTRQIVIQGADDSHWQQDGFGAHIMIMGLNSVAQVEGVEIRRCGQRRIVGRYPFHWHMLSWPESPGPYNPQTAGTPLIGDANPANQFIRHSSIHNSENRGVVIHGTCGVLVDNVYTVDVKAHSFFLEDGAEMRNTITNCVAMKVRDPGPTNRIKINDADASGFWLANPANNFTFNSASDCHGRGIWNSFATRCFGLSKNAIGIFPNVNTGAFGQTQNYNAISPHRFYTLQYSDNVGHSNRLQGITTEFITINEAGNVANNRYEPEIFYVHPPNTPWFVKPPFFAMDRMSIWKNRDNGYLHRVGRPSYKDWVAADNDGHDFIGQTMSAEMIGFLIIQKSLNSSTPFNKPLRVGLASYHFSVDIQYLAAFNYVYQQPQIVDNYQFVHGGGVLDSSDMYLHGVGLGHFRNAGWVLKNSHAGHITASPFFDNFPIVYNNPGHPQNGRARHWPISGAILDPFGYWNIDQQTGTRIIGENYLIPDVPFYNYGISAQNKRNVMPTQVQYQGSPIPYLNALAPHPMVVATNHRFYGISDPTINNQTEREFGGPSPYGFDLTRYYLDSQGNLQLVGTHSIGHPSSTLFIPGAKHWSVAKDGIYRLTINSPSLSSLNVTEFRLSLENAYRPEDKVVVGVPWDFTLSPNYQVSYVARGLFGDQTRNINTSGSTIASVINDSTGLTFYADVANSTIWINAVGGFNQDRWSSVHYPYQFDERWLERHQFIYVRRLP